MKKALIVLSILTPLHASAQSIDSRIGNKQTLQNKLQLSPNMEKSLKIHKLTNPIEPNDYYVIDSTADEVRGPYLTTQSLRLNSPSHDARLEEIGDHYYWVSMSKSGQPSYARALVDEQQRLVGVVRSEGSIESVFLDLTGDGSVDYAIISSPDRDVLIYSEAARNKEMFDFFNPFCSATNGSTDLSDFAHSNAQVNCSGTTDSAAGQGGKDRPKLPGMTQGGGGSNAVWDGLCSEVVGGRGALDYQDRVSNPWAAVVRKALKALGRWIGWKVPLGEDPERGTGDLTDPSVTGSYECEYSGPSCGSPDADYTPRPPRQGRRGSDKAQEPIGPDSPEENAAALARVCDNMKNKYLHWWSLHQDNRAVTTDCADAVTNPGKQMLMTGSADISCMPATDDNDPNTVMDDMLGYFRDGCSSNRVTQPGQSGQSDSCVSDLGGRAGSSLWYGMRDIVAAETAIEFCPAQVCKGEL